MHSTPCPCGLTANLTECCGRYLDGAPAPDAESLMRSRYTAYVLGNEAYLLMTWHPETRPERLNLSEPPLPKWLGLTIKQHIQEEDNLAMVEFVARYKVAGRAFRMHEISRFEKVHGRWYYLDGSQLED